MDEELAKKQIVYLTEWNDLLMLNLEEVEKTISKVKMIAKHHPDETIKGHAAKIFALWGDMFKDT